MGHVAARYAELTGNLPAAQRLIANASQRPTTTHTPQLRTARGTTGVRESWHLSQAIWRPRTRDTVALSIYPHYWHAMNGLAKVAWAQHRWGERAIGAARAAEILSAAGDPGVPLRCPDRARRPCRSAGNRGLIGAIERIGNAQGINDRLIALFYADHGMLADRAVTIARRDLASRDDIYAEDTLGWALATDGRWKEALAHAERAAALGTPDARLQFHTAMVELHNGSRPRSPTPALGARAQRSLSPVFCGRSSKSVAIGL